MKPHVKARAMFMVGASLMVGAIPTMIGIPITEPVWWMLVLPFNAAFVVISFVMFPKKDEEE